MAASYQNVNSGNGFATPVKGSGINHRNLNRHGRAILAANVVTGTRPFLPSRSQAAQIFGVSSHLLGQALKLLRQKQAPVQTTEATLSTSTTVGIVDVEPQAVAKADIPAIIAALQAYVDTTPGTREAKLAAMLSVLDKLTSPVNGSPFTSNSNTSAG